ncbi:putative Zn-finger protein [Trypanosoma grayi]|uniref:putative Zn-finger protein n=1 Tax=Trypanosoma grayi TaxID=71804 RepID=UPI0004F4571F|nr:putative Zn-finger protein [Trypanosoma grayi]KEG13819.1 putative Zn-finger protein [Trypanosoma grayi]
MDTQSASRSSPHEQGDTAASSGECTELGEKKSETQQGDILLVPLSSMRRRSDSEPLCDNEQTEQQQQHLLSTSDAKATTLRSPDCEESSGYMGECWLCRDSMSSPENPLITNVCRCRGSIGWIHRECIDEWVFSQRRTKCPSCDATYNILSSCEGDLPHTLSGELLLLLWKLFLPLMAKAIAVLLSAMVNGVAVPCAIGLAFYHKDIFSNMNSTSAVPLNDGISNDKLDDHNYHSTSEATTLTGVWLWTSVLLYGWICVAFWRCVKSGWVQWRSVFRQNVVEAERKWHPFTTVERAHWFVSSCLEWTGCTHGMVRSRLLELTGLVPLSFALRLPLGRVVLVLVLVIGVVFWRFYFPRKHICDARNRFNEVQEEKDRATDMDIALWFSTYIVEMVMFSLLMAICGGIVVHLALAPHLVSFPTSLEAFFEGLSLLRLILYWMIGTACSMILMQVETKIIVPLFAPGVDLFFIRSVDLNLDGDAAYWGFILAQIYDADPLRVCVDFVRMSLIELTALYMFLAAPLAIVFALHRLIMSGDTEANKLELPLPTGFPATVSGHDGNKSDVFFFSALNAHQQQHQELWIGNYSVSVTALAALLELTHLGQLFGLLLSLLRHATLVRWAVNVLIVTGAGTALACMSLFPVQRMQLKVLRPTVAWIARHVVCIEAFLFDAERLGIVDRWLRNGGEGNVPVPELPLASAFVRRERALPPSCTLPTYLKPRLILFSFLFFVISSTLFWIGPVVTMTLLLPLLPYSVPLVCGALNLFFFVLNPRLYFVAMTEFLLVCAVVVVGLGVQPVWMCLPLFSLSRRQLVRETVEFYHRGKRSVGVYVGEPGDSNNNSSDSEWEDISGSDVDTEDRPVADF